MPSTRRRTPTRDPASSGVPADQQPSAVPADQQATAVPADQQATAVPADQQATAVPADQQPSDVPAGQQPTGGTVKPAAAAKDERLEAAGQAVHQMFAGDPCAVSGTPLQQFRPKPPTELTNLSRVETAARLVNAYHYGTRLRFLAAVDRAREFLDDDKICLDDPPDKLAAGPSSPPLGKLLNCWPRFKEMLPPGDLSRLTARVLGIDNADVPQEDRNLTIQAQLGDLIDALNEVCDPGCSRDVASTAEKQRLAVAARRVRANFSASVSGGMTLRIRQFDLNLAVAQLILTELGPLIPAPPCSLGPDPGVFGTLIALVGDDLKADGIDVTESIEKGEAWTDIFTWLVDPDPAPVDTPCRAAAVLRPSYRRRQSKPCSG